MDRGGLPVIDPAAFDESGPRSEKSVVGVVLAAGTSRRYGEDNKLLASPDGEPVVRRAVRPFIEAGLADVVVVLGHEAEAVRTALADLGLAFVENPDYEAGQGTSVRAGTRYARDRDADAALFGLGDMPDVRPRTVGLILEGFERDVGRIVAAGCEGKRGNPVLFAAEYFEALSAIEGDTGGRELIYEADDAVCVETDDPGVLHDVNRPADHA